MVEFDHSKILGRVLFASNAKQFSSLFNIDNMILTKFSFKRNLMLNTYTINVKPFHNMSEDAARVRWLCSSVSQLMYRIKDLTWTSLNGSRQNLALMRVQDAEPVFWATEHVCHSSFREITWNVATVENPISCNCTNASLTTYFYRDRKGKCHSFLQQPVLSPNETIPCSGGRNITQDRVDDLVQDCHNPLEKDEILLIQVLADQAFHYCSNPNELPCVVGHSRCYQVGQICIFRLNEKRFLYPCRTGSHVQQCNLFSCSGQFFKCPCSYCVPRGYLCDGKRDCPGGEDEMNTTHCEKNCLGALRCKLDDDRIITCVSGADICNGVLDCPLGDDEHQCTVSVSMCTSPCACLNLAIVCTKTAAWDHSDALMLLRSTFVSFHCENLGLVSLSLGKFLSDKMLYVNLSWNSLREFCLFCGFKNLSLTLLDMSGNRLVEMKEKCFCNLRHLTLVSLSNNALSSLRPHSFSEMPILLTVNLVANQLHKIPKNWLHLSPKLAILHLTNNPITSFSQELFASTDIKYISTDLYHICCVKPPEATCSTEIPDHFSCSRLLTSVGLTVTFICVSISVVIFNSLLLGMNVYKMFQHYTLPYMQRTTDKTAGPNNVILCVQNWTDYLCGANLIIIWGADLWFEENFFASDKLWQRSQFCFTALVLSSLVSFMQPVSQLFLTLSRLMVVIFPFDTKFKSTPFVVKWILSLLLLVFAFALGISFVVTKLHLNSSPLCSALLDPTATVLSAKILSVADAVLKLATVVAVAAMNIALIRKTKQSSKSSLSQKNTNIGGRMLVQLFGVLLLNTVCWWLSSAAYLVSLFSTLPSVQLVHWTIAVVLPLSSVVHPVIQVLLIWN